MKTLFSAKSPVWAQDLGLLALRVTFGGVMLFGHGLSKLENWDAMKAQFTDLFGFGTEFDLAMAVFAEVGCSALLILGLATRWAALPLIATMAVAAFHVHAADPLFMADARPGGPSKEAALLFLAPFVCLLFTGPGRISLDAQISGGRGSGDD